MADQLNAEPTEYNETMPVESKETTEQDQAIDSSTNISPALAEAMNLSKEFISQNIGLELYGEHVFFSQCTETDGQVYLIFQGEKGNQYLIPPDSLAMLQHAESTSSNQNNENQLLPNEVTSVIETNSDEKEAVLNNEINASSKDDNSILNKDVDAPVEKDMQILETTAVSNESKNDNPPSNVEINNKIENETIETSSKNNVESNEENTIKPSLKTDCIENQMISKSSGSIIISCPVKKENSLKSEDFEKKVEDKKTTTNKKSELDSIESPKVVPNVANKKSIKDNLNHNSLVDDKFVSKSQLANSPKTYSRNSNIVWITPNSKSNENSSIKKIPSSTNKSLTTTIEVVQSDESSNQIDESLEQENDNAKTLNDSLKTSENKPNNLNQPKDISNGMNVVENCEINSVNTTKDIVNTNLNEESLKMKEIDQILEENIELPITKTIDSNLLKNDTEQFTKEVKKSSDVIIPKPVSKEEKIPVNNMDETEEKISRKSLRSSSKKDISTVTNENIIPADNNKKRLKTFDSKSESKSTKTELFKTSDLDDSKSKKKVTFNLKNSNNSNNNENTESLINEIEVSNQERSVKKFKASIVGSNESKSVFVKKETRSSYDYNDYKVNNLNICVRIQPEDRYDFMMETFTCENCSFITHFLNTYKNHKQTCSVIKYYSSPSFSNSTKGDASNSQLSVPIRKRRLSFESTQDLNFNETENNLTEQTENSSDEELSESQSDEECKTLDGHAEKDVVWVNTKVGGWPALILKIFANERKLSLRLIDSPLKKESLKTHIRSVTSFNDASVNKKFLKECKDHSDQLIKSVQKVEDYLRKRCLGTNINPIKFFNFAELYEITPKQATDSVKNNETIEVKKDDSKDAKVENKLPTIQIESSKLLKFIKDGRVETHLIGLYRVNIESERHKKFLEEEKNESNHTVFGPIKDEEQQDELFEYCSQLFKIHFENENIDIASYIYGVWVPEAIIKAISRVYHIDIKDSEIIFNQECQSIKDISHDN